MKREIITIDECERLFVPTDSDKIWMNETELAELFGVIGPTIRATIKAVYKSGIFQEYDTKRYIRLPNGNGVDVYNLELVIALAFRLIGRRATIVREWLVRKATGRSRTMVPIFISDASQKLC